MKKFKIADIELDNRYIQAPLAGYTSYASRKLAYKYGASLTYTEMISCNAINYKNNKTLEMLPYKKEDNKLALQLFGGETNHILEAVKYVDSNCVYDFLDFNFGCPVPKVIKQKAGSSYLTKQREDEMYHLLRKMVKISSRPVICKIRLGYKEFNYLDIAKLVEQAGVSMLAVHGRLQKEGFSGMVHYDMINQIKQNVNIPIVANGNIDFTNIDEVEKITNADAFMFGRSIMGYPRLFKNLIEKEDNLPITSKNRHDQFDDMLEHLNLLIQEKGEQQACMLFRGIACFYLKGLDQTKEIKPLLLKSKTKQEFIEILTKYR